MMFDKFEIKGELDENLLSTLKSMWNTEYSDLYDDLYFGGDNLSDHDLEEDIRALLETRRARNEQVFQRDFYIGLSFCHAVLPSLSGSLSSDSIEPFTEFLRLVSKGECVEVRSLPGLPSVDEVPGIVGESVSVFHDMRRMVETRNSLDAIMSMVDSCILGSAICHGSSDKRAIFNWFITCVIPSSEVFEVPAVIYTVDTKLPEAWSYYKL
ncbi:hypothetical protein [Hahella sp. NBU794]|uniref:hypothetical protein n=1 Tax=Hahella sp. NBU794 TaxID=3422590 RepID=UPI003D6F54D0